MNKLNFYLFDRGDESVGISGLHGEEITIESDELSLEDVKDELKDTFKELFDVEKCMDENEFKQYLKEQKEEDERQEKYYKSLEKGGTNMQWLKKKAGTIVLLSKEEEKKAEEIGDKLTDIIQDTIINSMTEVLGSVPEDNIEYFEKFEQVQMIIRRKIKDIL